MNRVSLSLLIPSLILVFLSLSVLYTLDISYLKQQIFFLLLSLIFYVMFLNINFKIFDHYSYFVYFFILIVLLISIIIGIEARGAVRWVEFFGLRIQFSEIFKPFFILFFASFLTKNEDRTFKKFIGGFALFFPLFILILRQPDLGNAMIYFITLIFMYFISGFQMKYFIFCGIVFLIPLSFIFSNLHLYQKQRIYTFLDVTSDPFGTSYNAVQSIISIGSGGFFGKGFGQATQSLLKFLPERHTDFIFATMAETLGFIGVCIILFLFYYLLKKMYEISQIVPDSFSYITISGIFFLTLFHVFFNIGMNLAILPIVGITLPFMSYGGSSLLTNFILIGIISSLSSEYRKKDTVEIR